LRITMAGHNDRANVQYFKPATEIQRGVRRVKAELNPHLPDAPL
jgi:hypothetical protein